MSNTNNFFRWRTEIELTEDHNKVSFEKKVKKDFNKVFKGLKKPDDVDLEISYNDDDNLVFVTYLGKTEKGVNKMNDLIDSGFSISV